jgi:two-component system chemotaxis response regulator CheY
MVGSEPPPDMAFAGELARLDAMLRQPKIPMLTGQDAAASPGPPAIHGSGEHWLRVLMAEDDFTSRVVLQGLLSRYGECHIAVNGKEAVEAFQAARQAGQAYDLICMDINMPEMDGQEAVKEIRAIEGADRVHKSSGVRIFMTTGIQDIKTVVASFKALCDAYLFKPIDGAKLEEHLYDFGLTGRKRH